MTTLPPPAFARKGLALRVLAAFGVTVAMAWSALAVWFQVARPQALALALLCAMAAACSIAGLLRAPQQRWTRLSILGVAALFIAVLGWWHSLQPSHERQWEPDVARLLVTTVENDIVTLDNVRAFEWETETRYTQRWETRQYDLAQLQSADLFLSYWMGPHIAHTLVSFGFADGRQLVLSMEIRKERGETFSAIGGFFRRYEQVIIAADERDLIRTRTNARGEDVYLYRLRARPEQLRAVLLRYLERAEALRQKPAFYNTLTSNCTTILFELARTIDPDLPLDWRLLASGHFAEYAYDQDALTPGLSYAELQQKGYINARARLSPDSVPEPENDAFSRLIRQGVPGAALPARQAHR